MARDVAAGFNEAEAWEQVNVAFDEAVMERGVVPVGPCGSEAGMAAAREFVVREHWTMNSAQGNASW
jgi:hypothetical protein